MGRRVRYVVLHGRRGVRGGVGVVDMGALFYFPPSSMDVKKRVVILG